MARVVVQLEKLKRSKSIDNHKLSGEEMNLTEARTYSDKYRGMLEPYCTRIEIAGSIRRERPTPNDIEFVCIVNPEKLFEFVAQVNEWEKVKGEPTGKYTQRLLPEGIKLDIFMATKENWGLILAIRTGSAEFSHKILAGGWVRAGFKSIDGMLTRNGEKFPVYEEEDLFRMIGVRYLTPPYREL